LAFLGNNGYAISRGKFKARSKRQHQQLIVIAATPNQDEATQHNDDEEDKENENANRTEKRWIGRKLVT